VQFRFENQILDSDRRELRRGAELVSLEPQVFDLLLYLIQNRDRVVSKDDLIASVWGGRIVSDSTLDSRINATRKAVGDSGDQQPLIRTVARKGVRFFGAVNEATKNGTSTSPKPATTTQQEVHFCTASDGVRIAYALAGSGPPLVKTANWLNHLEYDWESPVWSHLLHALAAEHRLIRYDERGNGLSDWNVNDISFEAFVRDLETVVDAARLDRFSLLGVSQGCPVSIAYAVRNPGGVSISCFMGATLGAGAGAAIPRRSRRPMRCRPSCGMAGARRTQNSVKSLRLASCLVARLSRCVGSTTCNE
jgi:DNA-binding winged helix-turn-helix (wHTH) protein